MELLENERVNGRLDDVRHALAVRQLAMNGYVKLESVYSQERVAELHAAYLKRFEPFVEETRAENRNGHYRMDLPFESPFVDEDVVANPFVLRIVEELLGSNCICQYFASNTCMPGSEYQAIHSDLHPLYPESNVTVPVPAIVLNIALVDFHRENGPTEIWPGGTHLTPENLNRPEYIQAAASHMQPMEVLMPAGSVSLRDLRMWHRGTQNRSDAPRPMIAIVYFRHWFGAQPLEIPKSTYHSFAPRLKELFRKATLV